ncbi:DEAD/DEAH box helicase [Succinivibrio dextrinosolvens]|uniref:Helicase conserved C-terminal domain-containing protein n=1 Tax=Succinivibrio dextrinosolvens TaxID=83771 RepID=A0A662Z834_9GAMM|nr:DEAD/DEAH box helicase [Succinivibrio dextrinosolvens]SFJ74828.1 Helicase conserved C-terminal domain-containing protein [Succinivibrio dextrinosolvens]
MELRPYQKEATAAVFHEWQEGRGKTLLIQATGTGKTVVFSNIVQQFLNNQKGRALILAHRDELLQQASDKLQAVTGIVPQFEKAQFTAVDSDADVVIGSVQTLTQDRRLNAYPVNAFDLIVVDEAHHCLSESYQKVLGYFNGAHVLGVTATPDRADKKDMLSYFDSVAYEYSMLQGVRDGYLSPLKALMIPLNIDISSVKVSCGDYVASDLGNALEPYLEQIAEEMTKYCMKRKTVVFMPLVAISQSFCELLNTKGFRAVEVNGQSEDRKERLQAFEDGKYNVIVNSMLLVEGWDCPSVDCLVNLRPTKSRALYTQIVGRILRLSPETGKKDALILDFLWMTQKLSLCRPSCIVAKDEAHAKKIDEMVENAALLDDESVDILDAEEQAEKDIIQERKESLAKELQAQRRKKAKLVDPLQFVFSINENLDDYEPEAKWEFEKPSPKQLALLEKFNINPDDIDTRGKATRLIDVLMRRAHEGLSTAKQIRLLERYGFSEVGTWTMKEAGEMITRIADNCWMVPFDIVPSQYSPNRQ